MPPTRRTVPRRLLLITTTFGLVTAAALPAAADPPTREPFTMLSVSCAAESDLGPLVINLSHSSTGAGAPGGDIVVWAPGADPEEDLPILSGYEEAIDREGATLRGAIPLHGPDDEPGYGLGDDPAGGTGDTVGSAVYEVTVTVAGPSTPEVVRGHVVDGGRTNQRYRNAKEHTPVVASGVLELPGAAPVALDGCVGSEVVEEVFVTSPATTVTSRRDPVGFECVAAGDGADALVQLTGGEAAVVIVPTGEEEPVAFGASFVDETRSAITATVAMVAPGGTDLGEATLHADLLLAGREVVRDVEDGATTTAHVEHLVVEGTVSFEGASYRLAGCETVRVREHRVDRGATAARTAAVGPGRRA